MTNFAHSLAIIIGIDAYDTGIPRLTTAVNDATRLAELLQDAHGYETLLLTEPAIGQPVTLERIRALFTEELSVRLGENDRLLVYFAGHGVALDGDDGPRGYLVPQDARPDDSASMLPMTDLHAWLTELPCRHMLAILDCCFAGAFRWSATRQIGALPDVIHKERYDRYLLSPAWQVLTPRRTTRRRWTCWAATYWAGARPTTASILHSRLLCSTRWRKGRPI
ncbi:MAG: caspase family protein [Anaerolineales bacterium]|nr:caspase family protein [Anaerolineales bacterium]